MPFIDSKVSIKVTDAQKNAIKSALGKSVELLNKTETFLMVGFSDEYTLYFAGEKAEKAAYIEVSLFGEAVAERCEKMTKAICDIYKNELDIPGDKIYISYHGVKNWGWNGKNF